LALLIQGINRYLKALKSRSEFRKIISLFSNASKSLGLALGQLEDAATALCGKFKAEQVVIIACSTLIVVLY